jgi:hypothetical protein
MFSFTYIADMDKKALEIVQKRKINLVLLGPESSELRVYSKSEQVSTSSQRLQESIIPDWLNRIEMPSDLSSLFMLFETIEYNNSATACVGTGHFFFPYLFIDIILTVN